MSELLQNAYMQRKHGQTELNTWEQVCGWVWQSGDGERRDLPRASRGWMEHVNGLIFGTRDVSREMGQTIMKQSCE